MTLLTLLYLFPRDGTLIPESPTARACAWRSPPSSARRRLTLMLGDRTCVKAGSIPFGPRESSFRLMEYPPSLLVGGRAAYNPVPRAVADYAPPPAEAAAWEARKNSALDAFAAATVADAGGAPTAAALYRLNPAEKEALLAARHAQLLAATAAEAAKRKRAESSTPAAASRGSVKLDWHMPLRFQQYVLEDAADSDGDEGHGKYADSSGDDDDGSAAARPLFLISPALPMLQHGGTYSADDKMKQLAIAEATIEDTKAETDTLALLQQQALKRFLLDSLDPAKPLFCSFCGFVENAAHFIELDGDDDGHVRRAACHIWEEEGDDGSTTLAQKWEIEGARRRPKRGNIPGEDQSLYSCNKHYWKVCKKKAFAMRARRSSGIRDNGPDAAAVGGAGQAADA
jgi:hypothetical protein